MTEVMHGEFQDATDKTLALLKVDPNRDTLTYSKEKGADLDITKYSKGKGADILTGTSSDGYVDFRLVDRNIDNPRAYGNSPSALNFRYGGGLGFYSLLSEKIGHSKIETDGNFATHHVEFHLVPSTDGYNNVMSRLGRAPGLDVFSLESVPGRSEFTGAEWVEGAAENKILTADIHAGNWAIASHDRQPAGHPNSWLTTPSIINAHMVTRAGELVDTWGDRLHSEGNKSAEISAYAGGMEGLQEYTSRLFSSISIEHGGVDRMMDVVRETAGLLTATERKYESPAIGRHGIAEKCRLFQNLGVIEPSEKIGRKQWDALEYTGAQYIRNIVDLCVMADRIIPAPNDRVQYNDDSKHELWAELAKKYAV